MSTLLNIPVLRIVSLAHASCMLVALAHSDLGFGHARLKPDGPVKVRDTNAGNKSGPCGPTARSQTPTTLKPGAKVTIQWEETIQHPGRYVFSFSSANDQNFQALTTVQDTQDNPNNLPHAYQVELTMPNIECESCTLQMIQVMTEDPANPSNYYSCADIRLSNNPAAPTPTPTPAKTGTPSPSSSATPVPSGTSAPGSTKPSSSDAAKDDSCE